MDDMLYIITIIILFFAILHLLTRPAQVKIIEVERPRRERPTGPVDVDKELQRIVRLVEARHGHVSTLRNAIAIVGDRRIVWWEQDGQLFFNFQDVLELHQAQAEEGSSELQSASQ